MFKVFFKSYHQGFFTLFWSFATQNGEMLKNAADKAVTVKIKGATKHGEHNLQHSKHDATYTEHV